MGRLWLLILGLLITGLATAQTDSLLQRDTLVRIDTLRIADSLRVADSLRRIDSIKNAIRPSLLLDSHLYNKQPHFNYLQPARQVISKRTWGVDKDGFFYLSIALLLFFALVRNNFSRYSKDLFKLFFRTTIKQRQIKEQLMQAPLPSLLLNILFFLSGGLYLTLILNYINVAGRFNFWLLYLYCVIGLIVIYLVKFITLKITGWIFKMLPATDAYTFIVFTTNKIMGVVLLPFIILLTFTEGRAQEVVLTLSAIAVGGLFLYRYFLAFVSLQRQVRIQILHFIIYLAAFEIVPLLLINKLLFTFLGESS